MSEEKETPENPSAFPVFIPNENGPDLYVKGMSLRDYFAAKAMQGMLANSVDINQGYEPYGVKSIDKISVESYQVADAMLKTRQK